VWKFWRYDGNREEEYNNPDLDTHYRDMFKHPKAPKPWYMATLLISIIMALVFIYKTHLTLPWWGFLVLVPLITLSVFSFSVLYPITGLAFIIQPFVQMISGFLHLGKLMANMYFVLFSCNFVSQAQLS
jgi:hypothetical protein